MKIEKHEDYPTVSEKIARICCDIPSVDVDEAWREMEGRLSAESSRRNKRHTRMRKRWLFTAATLAFAVAVSSGIYVSVGSKSFNKAEENNEPQPAKTVPVFAQSETFDSSLQAIMKRVSSVYGVEILFANPEKSSLKIHLEVDSGLSINEFVELLNNFESVKAEIVERDNTTYIEIK